MSTVPLVIIFVYFSPLCLVHTAGAVTTSEKAAGWCCLCSHRKAVHKTAAAYSPKQNKEEQDPFGYLV